MLSVSSINISTIESSPFMNPQDPNLTNVPNSPGQQTPVSDPNAVNSAPTPVMNEPAAVQPQMQPAVAPVVPQTDPSVIMPNTQTVPNSVPQQPTSPVAPPQSPQSFVSSASPVASAQPMTASPASSHNSPSNAPKKKLIIVGAGVALAIALVLVGALVLYPKLTKPSKQDYANTVTEVDQARSAYNSMLSNSTYISPSSTETEANNILDTLKKDKEKFDKEFADVANTKAVRKDKELKEAFALVAAKKPKFDSVIDVTAEALEHLYPISRGVSGISTSKPVDQITKVRRQFEAASSHLKDDNNKQYVQATVLGLKKLESIVPKILAGRADYRKYDSTATTQFYDTLDGLSDASKDWRSNLQKQAEEGDIKDEFNAFIEALEKKAFKG